MTKTIASAAALASAIFITIVVIAELIAPPASAHVPSECGQLFIDAGKKNQRLVVWGEEMFERVQDGMNGIKPPHAINNGWEERYGYLADHLAQIPYKRFAEALTAALACVEPGAVDP